MLPRSWALPLTIPLPQVQAASSRQGLTGLLPLSCPSTLLWSAGPSFSRCPPLRLVSLLYLGARGSWELGRDGRTSKSREGSFQTLWPSPQEKGIFQAQGMCPEGICMGSLQSQGSAKGEEKAGWECSVILFPFLLAQQV